MQATTRDDGTLVLVERMTFLRSGVLAVSVAISAALVLVQFQPGRLDVRTFLVTALVALGGFALAFFVPDREFEFHPDQRRMNWSVWRLAYARGGSLPFTDISSVVLQTDVDTEARTRKLTYRLVLVTTAGHLPVTSITTMDRTECDRLADGIRALLGQTFRTPAQQVVDLARASYPVGAVAQARLVTGASLAEARDGVDPERKSAA